MADGTGRTWPDDWAQRLAGDGCPMCANQGLEDSGFGRRIFEGEFADVFLQRKGPLPGYAVAIWKDGHVVEPTDLEDGAAAGYWLDVVAAARALRTVFAPAKMNYQTLGNAVPHLHTHLQPRYLDDPAPEQPLPSGLMVQVPTIPEEEFQAQVTAVRHEVGGRER